MQVLQPVSRWSGHLSGLARLLEGPVGLVGHLLSTIAWSVHKERWSQRQWWALELVGPPPYFLHGLDSVWLGPDGPNCHHPRLKVSLYALLLTKNQEPGCYSLVSSVVLVCYKSSDHILAKAALRAKESYGQGPRCGKDQAGSWRVSLVTCWLRSYFVREKLWFIRL